jgi:hypothetical protein
MTRSGKLCALAPDDHDLGHVDRRVADSAEDILELVDDGDERVHVAARENQLPRVEV